MGSRSLSTVFADTSDDDTRYRKNELRQVARLGGVVPLQIIIRAFAERDAVEHAAHGK